MLRYLPLLFIIGFVLEIASIIWVGRMAGVLTTLLLLFLGGFTGVSLLRTAGTGLAETFRSPVQSLSLQKDLSSRTMLRVMAGFLFIVPGFFSDIVALLLLLPPAQRWLAARVNIFAGREGPVSPQRYERIIDLEAVEITGDAEPPRGSGVNR